MTGPHELPILIGWIVLTVGMIGLGLSISLAVRDARALRRGITARHIVEDGRFRHCDDYIADPKAPKSLRWFLFVNRLPAVERLLCTEYGVSDPILYADYKGKRVRVVMASRLGDVGITDDLTRDRYDSRVAIEDLKNFSEAP